MSATSTSPQPIGPTRTCVGCRTAAPQRELLRIAVVEQRLVADPRRRVPGRGVYVHRTPACLTAAGKGGLARALKRSVTRADLDAIAAGASAVPAASQGGGNAVERATHLVSTPHSPVEPGRADRSSHGAHGA